MFAKVSLLNVDFSSMSLYVSFKDTQDIYRLAWAVGRYVNTVQHEQNFVAHLSYS